MAVKEYKYRKHSDKQRTMILETAKQLFMENEIKDVSMAQIAEACGITRATLYRYFENRDAVVWEIYISYGERMMDILWGKIRGKKVSAYEKIAVYLRGMVDMYLEMPEFYKFFFHFSKEYLSNQIYPDTEYTRELYAETGLTSGSTVAYITEDFADGSVREGLDGRAVGVAVVYGAFGALQIICGNSDVIPLKYGVDAVKVLVSAMENILIGLKHEAYHSQLAEHIWDDLKTDEKGEM